MDIPSIHLVKTDDVEDTSPLMMDAVEMYLSIKGKEDRTFIRTARRNGEYVSKVLGNAPSLPTHHQRLLSSETGALSKV